MARKGAASRGGSGGGKGGEDEAVLDDIEVKRRELENSAWLAAFLRELKKFIRAPLQEIRFLAVGNFGLEDRNAEYQTALVQILCERLSIRKVTAWDPNFKKRDMRVLSSLGINVAEKDPSTSTALLWFVPHAPYFLEPSLLERVKHCIYVGNDLTLSDANTMRSERDCAWYRASAQITPVKVKPKDPWREAFKNTAIHQLLSPADTDAANTLQSHELVEGKQ